MGGLLGGLNIENGDTTIHKIGSVIICNSHLHTGILYDVNSNKLDCAN